MVINIIKYAHKQLTHTDSDMKKHDETVRID